MKRRHNNLAPAEYHNKADRTPAENFMYFRRRVMVGAVAIAATAGLVFGAAKANETFLHNTDQEMSTSQKLAQKNQEIGARINASEAVTFYQLQQGEAEWNAARHVDGFGTVDTRDIVDYIKTMPQNFDVYADDQLSLGETLTIPESVSPN